jgi:outer membrane receptor protein involved in Fe transport
LPIIKKLETTSTMTQGETDIIYLLSDSLTVFGAMSYNDTEVTAIGSSIFADQLPPLGSPLPLTPKYQFSLRLRDELELGSYYGFWQVGMVYADETVSALLLDDALPQASYTVWDLSAGISKDDWRAQVFIENATDERANLHFNSQDDVPRITTNRPRTIGLRVSYDFE